MSDEFIPQLIKVFDYGDEVKEVIQIDYSGFGKSGGRKGNISKEVSEVDRFRNLQRVKRNVRRLAFANDLGQIHLVLTYKDNMQDVDKADSHFKKFMFNLHKIYPYLKYIATREFQKRGAVHYHVLLNQRIDHKKVQSIWTHGYITLVAHSNKLKAVMYVLKYIQKEVGKTMIETKNGHSKKAYLSSQGLKQEVENCSNTFLIRNPDIMVEFNDGINMILTNLVVGWDMSFDIDTPGRTLHGRSILRCASNNY